MDERERYILIQLWLCGVHQGKGYHKNSNLDSVISSLHSFYRQKLLEKLGEKEVRLSESKLDSKLTESDLLLDYINFGYNQLHDHVISIINEMFPIEKEAYMLDELKEDNDALTVAYPKGVEDGKDKMKKELIGKIPSVEEILECVEYSVSIREKLIPEEKNDLAQTIHSELIRRLKNE